MANIYIRLPISRCQFYRNRDAKKELMVNEPVRFSDYSEEQYVIRSSIYNKVLSDKIDSRFFSQQEWKNMMRGYDPTGKDFRMKRDPQQWLRYDEVMRLTGEKPNDKTQLFDYLAIRLPTEVFCIDTVRPVAPTWSIDKFGYNRLSVIMGNEFKRTVVDWALATFDYCTEQGRIILRAQQNMLERFLMRYHIDVSGTEKDSMRRVIDRWLKEEHCNYSSYTSFDMRYHDVKERQINIDGIEWV